MKLPACFSPHASAVILTSPAQSRAISAPVLAEMTGHHARRAKRNPLNDADRFIIAVSQIAGKRLTYAELTGKVGETAL